MTYFRRKIRSFPSRMWYKFAKVVGGPAGCTGRDFNVNTNRPMWKIKDTISIVLVLLPWIQWVRFLTFNPKHKGTTFSSFYIPTEIFDFRWLTKEVERRLDHVYKAVFFFCYHSSPLNLQRQRLIIETSNWEYRRKATTMTDALFKQWFKTWMLCSLLESTDETRHISAWRRTA